MPANVALRDPRKGTRVTTTSSVEVASFFRTLPSLDSRPAQTVILDYVTARLRAGRQPSNGTPT